MLRYNLEFTKEDFLNYLENLLINSSDFDEFNKCDYLLEIICKRCKNKLITDEDIDKYLEIVGNKESIYKLFEEKEKQYANF